MAKDSFAVPFLVAVDSDERREARSAATAVGDLGESLTRQSFTDECDIEKILRRFAENGGVFTHVNDAEPMYGDAASVGDFGAHQARMLAARMQFDSFSPETRKRFASFEDWQRFNNDSANSREAVDIAYREAKARQREGVGGATGGGVADGAAAAPEGRSVDPKAFGPVGAGSGLKEGGSASETPSGGAVKG